MNDGYPSKSPTSRAGLLARLTGAATLAAGALLYGNGSSQVQTLPAGTAGQVLVSAGAAAPAWTNIYGQANVWTSAQTIDLGTGVLPAQTGTPSLILSAGNTITPRLNADGFGSSGLLIVGRAIGGTRTGQVATPGDTSLVILGGSGYDTAASTGLAATYRIISDGLWSVSNNGAYHRWDGVSNGALVASRIEWMRLQNAMLGIAVTPAAAGGSLQLGTGSANGIGFQTGGVVDARIYRPGSSQIRAQGDNASTDQIVFSAINTTATGNNRTLFVVGKGTSGNDGGWMSYRLTANRVGFGIFGAAEQLCVGPSHIGFFGSDGAVKPTATGSRGGNAALASLLTGLAGLGLITDSTTA